MEQQSITVGEACADLKQINKLLGSSNEDDIILGIILAVGKMGEDWALDKFNCNPYGNNNYPVSIGIKDLKRTTIKFKKIYVWIGSISIEAAEIDSKRGAELFSSAKNYIEYDY